MSTKKRDILRVDGRGAPRSTADYTFLNVWIICEVRRARTGRGVNEEIKELQRDMIPFGKDIPYPTLKDYYHRAGRDMRSKPYRGWCEMAVRQLVDATNAHFQQLAKVTMLPILVAPRADKMNEGEYKWPDGFNATILMAGQSQQQALPIGFAFSRGVVPQGNT